LGWCEVQANGLVWSELPSGGFLNQREGDRAAGGVDGGGAGLSDSLIQALLGAFCAAPALFGNTQLGSQVTEAPRAGIDC